MLMVMFSVWWSIATAPKGDMAMKSDLIIQQLTDGNFRCIAATAQIENGVCEKIDLKRGSFYGDGFLKDGGKISLGVALDAKLSVKCEKSKKDGKEYANVTIGCETAAQTAPAPKEPVATAAPAPAKSALAAQKVAK